MSRTFSILLLLGIATASLPAQTPYAADDDTLFLYHFDEGDNPARVFTDSSGNGRDAIYGSAARAGLESVKGLELSAATAGKLEGRITWKDTSESNGKNSLLYKLPSGEFTGVWTPRVAPQPWAIRNIPVGDVWSLDICGAEKR